MKSSEFKQGIFESLMQCGFIRRGNLMCFSGNGAKVAIGVEKGFGQQWFVNVGFCIDRIGTDEISRIEQSHMYFRLDRLFAQHRELIVGAGALDDMGQPREYEVFLGLLASEVGEELKRFANEQAIADAYRAGRFREGLVTKSVRDLLSSSA
ncbi:MULTISPECIES: hypothetical protein [Burkholderia]|nr:MULTISPECIES: hypothetical protein [Burkholderia]